MQFLRRLLDSIALAGAAAFTVASLYGFVYLWRERAHLGWLDVAMLLCVFSFSPALFVFLAYYVLAVPNDGPLSGVRWRYVAGKQERRIMALERELLIEQARLKQANLDNNSLRFQLQEERSKAPAYVAPGPVTVVRTPSPMQADMIELAAAVWKDGGKLSRRRYTTGDTKILSDTRYRAVVEHLEAAKVVKNGELNKDLGDLNGLLMAIRAYTGVKEDGAINVDGVGAANSVPVGVRPV